MKPLNHSFHNCKLFQNRLNSYREIDSNLTQNEHVYAICCRAEVAGEVNSDENVKTIEGYALLNFEAVSISNFQENQYQPFV